MRGESKTMVEGSIFSARLKRLWSSLEGESLDAVLFVDPVNIRYLCGFSGSDGLLLVEQRGRTLIVDGRYTEQARREVDGVDLVEYADKLAGILEVIKNKSLNAVGFEAPALTYDRYMTISKDLPESVRLVPLVEAVARLRACKDDGELSCLREAAAIAARALETSLLSIEPGMREIDFARLLDWNMIREGSERPAFDTIVASGSNGALPHARPGSKTMERGDFVVIDYGAVCEGYHSDESCTIVLGQADGEGRRVYDAVLTAHDRAVAAVRPGVLCREIDAVARDVIEQAGFGSCFVHATGHGLGLKVHEAPALSKKSEERLEEGMVITIEPGIYLPGRFGVRIEDTILVTADGHEIISRTSKRLKEL